MTSAEVSHQVEIIESKIEETGELNEADDLDAEPDNPDALDALKYAQIPIPADKISKIIDTIKQVSESRRQQKAQTTGVSGLDAMKKESLFEEEDNDMKLFVQFTLKRIGINKRMAGVTPHPYYNDLCKVEYPFSPHLASASVALIVRDLPDATDYMTSQNYYINLLEENGILEKWDIEVIPLRALNTEYQPYEMKRYLANRFEVFLADERIYKFLPAQLGKNFLGRKKWPIAVDMTRLDLFKEIDKAMCTAMLCLTGRGSTSAVHVGYLTMSTLQLTANIQCALVALLLNVPAADTGDGLNNIRNIYLSTSAPLALPLFMNLDTPNDIPLPPPRKSYTQPTATVDEWPPEEISTYPHSMVKVTPDLRLFVVDQAGRRFESFNSNPGGPQRARGPSQKARGALGRPLALHQGSVSTSMPTYDEVLDPSQPTSAAEITVGEITSGRSMAISSAAANLALMGVELAGEGATGAGVRRKRKDDAPMSAPLNGSPMLGQMASMSANDHESMSLNTVSHVAGATTGGQFRRGSAPLKRKSGASPEPAGTLQEDQELYDSSLEDHAQLANFTGTPVSSPERQRHPATPQKRPRPAPTAAVPAKKTSSVQLPTDVANSSVEPAGSSTSLVNPSTSAPKKPATATSVSKEQKMQKHHTAPKVKSDPRPTIKPSPSPERAAGKRQLKPNSRYQTEEFETTVSLKKRFDHGGLMAEKKVSLTPGRGEKGHVKKGAEEELGDTEPEPEGEVEESLAEVEIVQDERGSGGKRQAASGGGRSKVRQRAPAGSKGADKTAAAAPAAGASAKSPSLGAKSAKKKK